MKEKNVRNGERQRWIDIYKGIAIALVVLGHLRIGDGLYRFLFLFHMYLFFFVGGVNYRYKPHQRFSKFLWRNVKRLYVPYALYSGLWVATALAMGLYRGELVNLTAANLGKNLLNILLGGGLIPGAEEVGPAWFLCALLCVRVIYDALSRLCKHDLLLMGIPAGVCFVLAYVLEGKALLPLRLVQSLSAITFFYVGDLCKKPCAAVQKQSNSIRGVVACAAGAVAMFGIVAWLSRVSDSTVILIGNSLPDCWVVTIISGGAGCLGLALLSMVVEQIPGAVVVAYYGVHSMIVMGLHSEIRVVLHLVLETLLKLPSAWIEPLTFILTFVLCIPAVYVISRHIPVLTGREKAMPMDQ